MFVSLPSRKKPGVRWAAPTLLVLMSLAFLWAYSRPHEAQRNLWLDWGALSGGLATPEAWWAALRDGSALRLFTALFLHADWAHLLATWCS